MMKILTVIKNQSIPIIPLFMYTIVTGKSYENKDRYFLATIHPPIGALRLPPLKDIHARGLKSETN